MKKRKLPAVRRKPPLPRRGEAAYWKWKDQMTAALILGGFIGDLTQPGVDAEPATIYVLADPRVQRIAKRVDPRSLRRELAEYGAWDTQDLRSTRENLKRMVWLLAGDYRERMHERRRR